jgi:hypothetical protein
MVRTLHRTDSRRKLVQKINEAEPNGKIKQKEFPPRIELGSPESESGMLTTTSWEQFEATGKQGHMIELAIVDEIWDHVLRCTAYFAHLPGAKRPFHRFTNPVFFPYLEIVACNT